MADATFTDKAGNIRLIGTLIGGTSVAESIDQIVAANATAADWDNSGFAITGLKDLAVSGLTGAASASRYAGATASGAPVAGTFAQGDFVIARNGHVFVCTVAGTPGTWVDAGSVGNLVTSVFSRTGAVVATAGDYTGIAVGGTADALAALALTNAMVSASAAIAASKLAPGLAGQVLQGVTPSYAYPPGFEIAYDQITSGVNVVSTTEGTPTAIIAGTAHTYENVPYVAEFFSPSVTDSSAATGTVTVLLIADGSSIGRIAVQDSVSVTTQMIQALTGKLRFTPTAASHTYGISAYVSSTTGTPAIGAGAGGSGVLVPAFVRITKA